MVPELKAKWLVALRSGEFKQGRGKLEYRNRFCCLGVLRHVANPADERAIAETLTDAQCHEYGLDASADNLHHLANMNDGYDMESGARKAKKYTFAEIADYIEAHL